MTQFGRMLLAAVGLGAAYLDPMRPLRYQGLVCYILIGYSALRHSFCS